MNTAYLILGVLGLLAGLTAVSLAWRSRRYWRTLRQGTYIDLTVVGATVGDRGPHGTVWVKTILDAALPSGRTRRITTTLAVHLDRIEEVRPGLVLRGRVDPRDGEIDGYDYIQVDADHLAERPGPSSEGRAS